MDKDKSVSVEFDETGNATHVEVKGYTAGEAGRLIDKYAPPVVTAAKERKKRAEIIEVPPEYPENEAKRIRGNIERGSYQDAK